MKTIFILLFMTLSLSLSSQDETTETVVSRDSITLDTVTGHAVLIRYTTFTLTTTYDSLGWIGKLRRDSIRLDEDIVRLTANITRDSLELIKKKEKKDRPKLLRIH